MSTTKEQRQRLIREGQCVSCYKTNPDTSRTHCPPCRLKATAKTMARYNQDPEKARRLAAQYRQNSRTAALTAYGGKCVCCGETYEPYLEFDHINGGGTEHRKQLGNSGSNSLYNRLKREGYPDYIQVLCANCHTAKSKSVPCKAH